MSEARHEQSELNSREYDQEKSNIQRYILSAEVVLTNFLPFFLPGRCQNRLGTAIHKIWVSLISITK